MGRRGEMMDRSTSCPSLSISAPAASSNQSLVNDTRKEAAQRQTDGHFKDRVPRMGPERCSINRVENGEFSVVRKNNHHCQHDKLTRTDPYYSRPSKGMNNLSVKYDIISNERKWFRY